MTPKEAIESSRLERMILLATTEPDPMGLLLTEFDDMTIDDVYGILGSVGLIECGKCEIFIYDENIPERYSDGVIHCEDCTEFINGLKAQHP